MDIVEAHGDQDAPPTNSAPSTDSRQLERLSEATRKAIGQLVDRARQGVGDDELNQVSDRLDEVQQRIDAVVANLPDAMRDRAAGLEQTAQEAQRIRDVLLSDLSLTIRDYGAQVTRHAERFETKFGNLILIEEVQALKSQTDITSSYIATASADSAILTHIDSYGRFLNDWWHISVGPTADLLNTATTGTSQLSVTTRVSAPLSSVLEESRGRRAAEVSQELESTLDSVRKATTAAGEVSLTSAFDEVRDQARRGSRLWTTVVFICVALGIGIPFLAISVDADALAQLSGLTGLVIKALSGLPLFALAAYSGHIAAQHRETSRHLTILIAQLKSVQAYANELPSEQRLRLMSKLGDRAFADPGFTLQEKGLSMVPEGATQALGQIRAIVENASRAGR
ncbi:hypothetical protein [Mycolicibacterium celeriflavum]|uniref:hypothetical protein n=1 Tax=Mycolicibacterium celeriflavum TaxID=1249101 RepID=UPI003CF2AB05